MVDIERQYDIERHGPRRSLMLSIIAAFGRLGREGPRQWMADILANADSFGDCDFEGRYALIARADEMASRLDEIDIQTARQNQPHIMQRGFRHAWTMARLSISNRRYKLEDYAWHAVAFFCMACHPQTQRTLEYLCQCGFDQLAQIDRLIEFEATIR